MSEQKELLPTPQSVESPMGHCCFCQTDSLLGRRDCPFHASSLEPTAPNAEKVEDDLDPHFKLALLLGEIGWVASHDAQWDHLRENIDKIRTIVCGDRLTAETPESASCNRSVQGPKEEDCDHGYSDHRVCPDCTL